MTTRTVLAVVMCVTVVFAGCAGFGGGGSNGTTASSGDASETTAAAEDTTAAEDETTTVAEDTATATEGEDTAVTEGEETTAPATDAATTATMVDDDTTMAVTTSAANSEGTTPSGSEAFRFLAFEQPGTYTYEMTMGSSDGQEQNGEYVIEVVEASESQYEVQVSLSMGEMSSEQTFTGTRQAVQQQLLSSQAGALLAPLTTMTGFYGGRPLQVGQSWSYSTEQGTAGLEVTGTDSYAGVECFVSEASVNGSVVHEACASPDRGLAPYAAYYDESGTLTFEMVLVNYEEG